VTESKILPVSFSGGQMSRRAGPPNQKLCFLERETTFFNVFFLQLNCCKNEK